MITKQYRKLMKLNSEVYLDGRQKNTIIMIIYSYNFLKTITSNSYKANQEKK